MDLHHDPAALAQADAEAGLDHRLLAAGRPRADPRGLVDVLERVEPGAAEAGPALVLLGRVLGLGRGDLLRAGPGTGSRGAPRRGCRAAPGCRSATRPCRARGRAGSTGSRRCRCRRARTACSCRASRSSYASRPRAAPWTSPARRSGRCGPPARRPPRRSATCRRRVRGLRGALRSALGTVAAAAGGQGRAGRAATTAASAGRVRDRRQVMRLRPGTRSCATSRRARGGGCGRRVCPAPAPVLATRRYSAWPAACGDLVGQRHEVADDWPGRRPRRRRRSRGGRAGIDQRVERRLRVEVLEGDRVVVAAEHLGGDLAGDDRAEDAVATVSLITPSLGSRRAAACDRSSAARVQLP